MSSDNPETLLIIDGHNVALRAYHALGKQAELLTNDDGEGTWGVYGFFTTLVHFVNKYRPHKVAVTFDWGQSEQRLEILPEYKAHRKHNDPEEVKKRQESRRQVDVLIRLLETFNINVLREPNVEADDIIAKIVRIHLDDTVVVTGDHDLRQLITDRVIIVKPSIGVKPEDVYDYQRIVNDYGMAPSRLPEVWALSGDTSDNIPGIPGVGEKTAIELLLKYGSIEEIFLSDEKKVQGLRDVVDTAYKLIYLDGSYCRLQIPDLTFKPVKAGSEGADRVLEALEHLGFNSIKMKWITGKLWSDSDTSIGKRFHKEPDE